MCQFCNKGFDDGVPCFCPDQFEEHRIDWESGRPEAVAVWMVGAQFVFLIIVVLGLIIWGQS